MKRMLFTLLLATMIAGCSTVSPQVTPTTTDDSNSTYQQLLQTLPEAKPSEIVTLQSGDHYNIDITEVKMKLNGHRMRMLSYNGSIPGPLIQAPQSSTVIITVNNKVPDMETTLHSHGVRLDNLFDGVPFSMMGKQNPIAYGSSFQYTITFPDVGLFRYHPHIDEQIQQELGLYGNYLIIPNLTGNANPWTQGFDAEHILVLDDIQLTSKGIPQVQLDSENQMMMGRYGNQMLINGKEQYNLTAHSGEIIRLYITNVANVRPFNLEIPGVQMKLIGSDVGLYEKPSMVKNIIVGPAERYIVDVYLPSAGKFTLTNRTPNGSTALGTITVSDNNWTGTNYGNFLDTNPNGAVLKEIDAYRSAFNKPIDKTLILEMTAMGGMMGGNRGQGMGMMGGAMMGSNKEKGEVISMPGLSYDSSKIEREDSMAMMNDMSDKDNTKRKIIDNDSKEENMNIDRSFKQGDLVKIHIINKADGMHPMQHPVHFHGQRFLVLNHNGIVNTNLVRKDTVLIGVGDTVDILVEMQNPGTRMAHCHIAEHLMNGMMMHFDVEKDMRINQQ